MTPPPRSDHDVKQNRINVVIKGVTSNSARICHSPAGPSLPCFLAMLTTSLTVLLDRYFGPHGLAFPKPSKTLYSPVLVFGYKNPKLLSYMKWSGPQFNGVYSVSISRARSPTTSECLCLLLH